MNYKLVSQWACCLHNFLLSVWVKNVWLDRHTPAHFRRKTPHPHPHLHPPQRQTLAKLKCTQHGLVITSFKKFEMKLVIPYKLHRGSWCLGYSRSQIISQQPWYWSVSHRTSHSQHQTGYIYRFVLFNVHVHILKQMCETLGLYH